MAKQSTKWMVEHQGKYIASYTHRQNAIKKAIALVNAKPIGAYDKIKVPAKKLSDFAVADGYLFGKEGSSQAICAIYPVKTKDADKLMGTKVGEINYLCKINRFELMIINEEDWEGSSDYKPKVKTKWVIARSGEYVEVRSNRGNATKKALQLLYSKVLDCNKVKIPIGEVCPFSLSEGYLFSRDDRSYNVMIFEVTEKDAEKLVGTKVGQIKVNTKINRFQLMDLSEDE